MVVRHLIFSISLNFFNSCFGNSCSFASFPLALPSLMQVDHPKYLQKYQQLIVNGCFVDSDFCLVLCVLATIWQQKVLSLQIVSASCRETVASHVQILRDSC